MSILKKTGGRFAALAVAAGLVGGGALAATPAYASPEDPVAPAITTVNGDLYLPADLTDIDASTMTIRTESTTVPITGTGEPGFTIRIFHTDPNGPSGWAEENLYTTVAPDGSWSLSVPTPPVGELRAIQTLQYSQPVQELEAACALEDNPSAHQCHWDGTTIYPNPYSDLPNTAAFIIVANDILAGTVAISGSPAVGEELTATTDGWASDVTLSYQWYVDGVAVSSATGATYTPSADDAGKSVTVVVTASKDGVDPVSAESDPVVIAVDADVPVIAPLVGGAAALAGLVGLGAFGIRRKLNA